MNQAEHIHGQMVLGLGLDIEALAVGQEQA